MKGTRMSSWHTEKKIIIGLITTVTASMLLSLFQFFYVVKSLDTDPPLVNRVIALEYHNSEQGRINQQILDEIKESRKERESFRAEQLKRTTIVYDAAEHMKDEDKHRSHK